MNKIVFLLLFLATSLSANKTLYFDEELYNDIWAQKFQVDELIFEDKSDFQDITIFENEMFGRVLAIDGIIQITEKDEFVYQEMLTHIPMFAHQNPKHVLVIGGGDGGIIREVLKHPELESVTLVELDSTVIDISKKYLPSISDGAFENPKVQVVIQDGCQFVKDHQNEFDVIIVDSTDPIGPGQVLFTSEFYGDCKSSLKEDGILVCQNGVPFLQKDELVNSHERRREHFETSSYYVAPIPTYVGGFMAFGIASDKKGFDSIDKEALTKRVAKLDSQLRYYNPSIHLAAFALPNYMLAALEDN